TKSPREPYVSAAIRAAPYRAESARSESLGGRSRHENQQLTCRNSAPRLYQGGSGKPQESSNSDRPRDGGCEARHFSTVLLGPGRLQAVRGDRFLIANMRMGAARWRARKSLAAKSDDRSNSGSAAGRDPTGRQAGQDEHYGHHRDCERIMRRDL